MFGIVALVVAGVVAVCWLALSHARKVEIKRADPRRCYWVSNYGNERCELEIEHAGPHLIDGKWHAQAGQR